MSRRWTVAVLPGDGIGPEVMVPARNILQAWARWRGWDLRLEEGLVGGAALDRCGQPLPLDTLALCRRADAVLLGSVGGPRWDHLPTELRPETGGLLALRKELSLFANLRPVSVLPALAQVSHLRPERLGRGVDLVTVRELSSGIYFGVPRGQNEEEAWDTMRYRREEVERVAHVAFRLARTRRGRVCSVDKANVLCASRLWREVVTRVGASYPDVVLEHQYVDNAAMQLMLRPDQYDVILTSNLFGDILSDASAALAGSLGLLPSASLGADGGTPLFEPAGGSAPDLAGRDLANPVAQILSVALLGEHALGDADGARVLRSAVDACLAEGKLTADLAPSGVPPLGTCALGEAIREAFEERIEAVA